MNVFLDLDVELSCKSELCPDLTYEPQNVYADLYDLERVHTALTEDFGALHSQNQDIEEDYDALTENYNELKRDHSDLEEDYAEMRNELLKLQTKHETLLQLFNNLKKERQTYTKYGPSKKRRCLSLRK